LRYFLHIGYNGIHYHGWQRQREAVSVREVMEAALTKILKTDVSCIGCGRTDSQVHASQYFLHVDIEKVWDFDLLFRLNKLLPRDIAVFDIIQMEGHPHARFDAVLRTYDYFIHTYKDPFLNERSSLYLNQGLRLDRMKEAIDLMTRHTDYRALCLTPDKQTSTICKVSSAKLFSNKNADRLRFQISSNRFLRGMIRISVAKLLDIGTGMLSVDEFESYLITGQKTKHVKPAYPQGLYLSKVTYPFLDIAPRTEFSAILQNGSDSGWNEI
jgi:tRNA pseudouridine38-40 synthase